MTASYQPAPNPLGKRLKHEMKKRGISSARLAEVAGVKTSFIYDVISGKSANPSTIKLARVADVLGVSLNALLDDRAAAAPYTLPPPANEQEMLCLPELMLDFSELSPAVRVSFTQAAPYAFSRLWLKEHVRSSPEDLRWHYVQGDSMEPLLSARDIVLVDVSQRAPSPPGLFVLYDQLGLTVRRVEPVHAPRSDACLRIHAENPQYESYEKLLSEVQVIGRVVWGARTF